MVKVGVAYILNTAVFREHADIRFTNAQHNKWALCGPNPFALKKAPPVGHFWCS